MALFCQGADMAARPHRPSHAACLNDSVPAAPYAASGRTLKGCVLGHALALSSGGYRRPALENPVPSHVVKSNFTLAVVNGILDLYAPPFGLTPL